MWSLGQILLRMAMMPDGKTPRDGLERVAKIAQACIVKNVASRPDIEGVLRMFEEAEVESKAKE